MPWSLFPVGEQLLDETLFVLYKHLVPMFAMVLLQHFRGSSICVEIPTTRLRPKLPLCPFNSTILLLFILL